MPTWQASIALQTLEASLTGEEPAYLQRELDHVGKLLVIAAVPGGLLAIVTTTMALGVRKVIPARLARLSHTALMLSITGSVLEHARRSSASSCKRSHWRR